MLVVSGQLGESPGNTLHPVQFHVAIENNPATTDLQQQPKDLTAVQLAIARSLTAKIDVLETVDH